MIYYYYGNGLNREITRTSEPVTGYPLTDVGGWIKIDKETFESLHINTTYKRVITFKEEIDGPRDISNYETPVAEQGDEYMKEKFNKEVLDGVLNIKKVKHGFEIDEINGVKFVSTSEFAIMRNIWLAMEKEQSRVMKVNMDHTLEEFEKEHKLFGENLPVVEQGDGE